MEHCDSKGPLPLDPSMLGEQAMKCRAYAKALNYINNKLGQKEAAAGLLEWGRENLKGELKVRERWYEKLNEWEKALEAYKRKEGQGPEGTTDSEVLLGQMR